MTKTLSIFSTLMITSISLIAQQNQYNIYGEIKDTKNGAISEVLIYNNINSTAVFSDKDGKFNIQIETNTEDSVELMFQKDGFGEKSAIVRLNDKEAKTQLKIVLENNNFEQLDGVVIKSKSAIQQVRETPFNVVALDAKSKYNTNLDLAHLLDKAPGVKVRESGGVGSDVNISLNGFTGRHVKVFMDGVPMQGFGSSFQINNIPVSVAERIEVYKGVVPVEFGADAIGGVINIVTNQSPNSYIDASYSYGSFNTHRASVSLGHTTKSKFSVQLNAFYNYSDNDYKVKTIVLQQNGQYSNPQWVRRFHDSYENKTVMAKVGFVGKKWADRIYVGLTASEEQMDVQNSSLLQFVYGERTKSSNSLLPSFEYYKRNLLINGLTLRVTANYNYSNTDNVDTASRRYNWLGEYVPKNTKGEIGVNTISKYKNENIASTATLSYEINKHHTFSINNVLTSYERKMSSDVPIDQADAMDSLRRMSMKNVTGLSYKFRTKNWNATAFGKHYIQSTTGPYDSSQSISHPTYVERNEKSAISGYGLATTYFLKNVQIKASAEKAFRLPTDNELFGDELLETANGSLRPEQSMNYNLGLTINKNVGKNHNIYAEINGFHRMTTDYIRRVQEARFGTMSSINHGKVSTLGMDAEVRYYYKNKFSIGGTITYQDVRNKEKLRTGTGTASSGTYNDRLPNVPIFFGNMEATYYKHDLFRKGNVLSLSYNVNYIDEFYLLWESQGSKNSKSKLPTQIAHDFNATYSMQHGKYNVSLEVRNITNEFLYDNFSLQKPGRAGYVKFRYYFLRRPNQNKNIH